MSAQQFKLNCILACVAITKSAPVFAPLEELLDLLEYMTGERFGPSIVPDFQYQVASCGLALVRQYPALGRIQSWPQEYGAYEGWLAEQQRRFGRKLPVRSIEHDALLSYQQQADEIVARLFRKVRREKGLT